MDDILPKQLKTKNTLVLPKHVQLKEKTNSGLAMAPPPDPSAYVSVLHRSLRLGTFSVGLGFLCKLSHILAMAW